MANQSTDQLLLQHRDGVSQAQRQRAALVPDYVAVDDRSLKDLLAFARQYAKELRYYNLQNQEAGDWSAFLAPDLSLDEVVAFVRDPDQMAPANAQRFRQPHFVLFLTFLQLLQHAQQQMNLLTKRHLDFYYQQALQMQKRPAVPDYANVIVELTAGVEQTLLPAGARLQAGTDSLGQALVYQTDRDIVVNRAQVARLSSVYVEKQITGIREAHELHRGPKPEKFLHMLKIVYGDPKPGDTLPRYETDEEVTYDFLLSLQRLVNFVRTDVLLEFVEFLDVMSRKRQRDHADGEWATINNLLEQAGRKRTGNATFRIDPRSRDFDANLVAALGTPTFDEITEVDNIYDAYDQRIREKVQKFIRERLFFDNLDDFVRMMQLKVRIDNEWRAINSLLEKAGRSKRGAAYVPPQPASSPAFAEHLKSAVEPNFSRLAIANIDDYYAAFLRVQKYFFMSAADFSVLMETAEKPDAPAQEWDNVYAVLATAYKEKIYAGRRAVLQKVREAGGFDALLRVALGDTQAELGEAPLLTRLEPFVKREVDRDTLQVIQQQNQTGTVSLEQWDEVYHIVEIAQRNRENLPEPVVMKEEWRNLYPAADATTVGASLNVEHGTETSRWKTFGRYATDVNTDKPPAATFGWALSSPLLFLAQGVRTITLTLGFAAEQFNDAAIVAALSHNPFLLQLSTEEGWMTPDILVLKSGPYAALSGIADGQTTQLRALQVQITLDEKVAPITRLSAEDSSLSVSWPVLQLLLRPVREAEMGSGDTGRFITNYQPFRALQLVRTHIKVEVKGLSELQLENDDTTLTAGKPFEPFGTTPAAGSRFLLGHAELVSKKLDRLDFHLEWMGGPENLGTYYNNYPALQGKDHTTFTMSVNLIDKRLTLPIEGKARLFAAANANAPQTITVAHVPSAVQSGRAGAVYTREPDLVTEGDVHTWSRYLQWELNTSDFQHAAYPAVVTQKSLELAAAIAKDAKTVDATKFQVNPPYTPKLKSLSVDYSSSIEIKLADYHSASQIDQILHIHPFGYSEVQPEPQTTGARFLPQYDNEGELYIGISDLQPPQTLSLLLQMAEGSADPDVAPTPVHWSYLSNNQWVSLENGNILLDTTRGLINTGIIEFSLAPAGLNTVLAPDLYWLRVSMAQNSDSVCDTVALRTQAVSATFVDQNNAPDHLSTPLPAQTISQLVETTSEISAIHQPYTSSGGKSAEQDSHLYTRVSERLRHKQRALTMWDYEHLVLQQFPEMYKVKCIPAKLSTDTDEPGRVELVVIPNIKDKLPFNPFEPKAPANLLADITTYLADKVPSSATVVVKNAYYVPVKLRFAVRFLTTGNEGFYKQELNAELIRFLSPWAYGDDADIVIGGRIYANTIIHFIEERPYVDYVAEVKMFTSEDRRIFRFAVPTIDDGYYVATERPDGVLVTVRQHEIDIITEADFEREIFRGINYMKIELDFVVGGN